MYYVRLKIQIPAGDDGNNRQNNPRYVIVNESMTEKSPMISR